MHMLAIAKTKWKCRNEKPPTPFLATIDTINIDKSHLQLDSLSVGEEET